MSEQARVAVRVGHFEFPEPLPRVRLTPGFNCNISVRIGKQLVRMCVDTGGAQSLMRAEFRRQLAKSEKTKSELVARFALEDPVPCGGVCSSMTSPDIERITRVRFWLDPVSEDGSQPPASLCLK